MGRYFFHLSGPDFEVRDEIGLVLPGVDAAHEQVRLAIPDTFRELFDDGHDPFEWRFEVTDGLGRVLFETPFSKAAKAAREHRSWAPRSARVSAELAQAAFSHMFETSPAAHLFLTLDRRIIAANPAYLAMTGLVPDRLVGLSMFDAFPRNTATPSTTDGRSVLASLRRAIRSGRPEVQPFLRYDELDSDGNWRERYWRTITRAVRIDRGPSVALDVEVTDLTAYAATIAGEARRDTTLAAAGSAAARPQD
jgi:PAS domain S-box-containing protein